MNISARTHYATVALAELAIRREEGEPVSLAEIANKHSIPGPFLTQIFRTLRSAGWVRSVRGAGGGYRLCVAPETVTVLDIAEKMGCGEVPPTADPNASACSRQVAQLWTRADEAARETLRGQTLADVLETIRDGDAAMYFI